MKTVIRCEKISKSYRHKEIFKDFSYSFNEKGLYVLFGESGSGKTTLLNTITGAINFDSGKVSIYKDTYEKQVKYDEVKDYIAYITQNNYFVDYLTMYDNLLLSLSNRNHKGKIKEYLKKFKLEDKQNSYPSELSGGEQQRMSIIIALLQNKKIIILDEPTSSLDIDNRDLILNILQELKKDHLIICATHDRKLVDIADKKIDFNDLKSLNNDNEMGDNPLINKNKVSIFPRMVKQLWYKKRNIRANIFLVIVFTIIVLGFDACYNYKEKLRTSLLNIYKINFLNYRCNLEENEDFCESVIEKYNGYNTFLYASNINLNVSNEVYKPLDYNTNLKTLPFYEEKIPIMKDLIEYGTYFENENDIIIGRSLAMQMNKNLESLIGSSYKIKLPDKEENFRIVGILRDITNNDYFRAMISGNQLNYQSFISDKYTNKYRDNDTFKKNGNYVSMRVFFENNKDLMSFYNTYSKEHQGVIVEKLDYNYFSYNGKIVRLQYYLYPALITAFIVVLLFYYQIENIQNKYRKHILSIYNYYGYNWKEIIFSSIITSIISVMTKFGIGVALGLLLGAILNPILLEKNIIHFILFIPDYFKIFLLAVLLIILAIIFSLINSFLLKKNGWLKSLKEEGDLL